MQHLIKRASLLVLILSTCIHAQTISTDSIAGNLSIPDEILSQIPSSELPQFLTARQRVIDKKEMIPANAYEEIGVAKEVLIRIPSSDLLEFLNERGYVEILAHEHVGSSPSHGDPPSPQQMIKLLYMILIAMTLLIVIRMIFIHLSKKKDQEIILKALEHQKEIPVDLMTSNRQRSYLTNAVLFSVFGLAVIVIGWFELFPGILGVIPLSIGIGYFLIRYLTKKQL